jgi:hypothetical protein
MALLLIGAALGFLYVARTILSARSENRTPTLIDQLAVLGMVGVLALAVVTDNQVVNEQDTVELGVAALGLVFGIFSLMTLLLGRREGDSNDARGWLGIGIGLIIISTAFAIPMLNQAVPAPTEVAFVLPTAINDGPPVVGNTLSNQRSINNSQRLQIAPTQTPLSLDTTIPSPEAPDIYFFTPTPTPEGLACEGVIEVDLNLRKYPSVAEGNIVGLAPQDEEVLITGRNEATSWYYITFDIYEGWVDADFVQAGDACDTIPPRAWSS